MRLVLQRSLTISGSELERVMQAVLFYSDQVLVRATAVSRPAEQTIYRRMNELADMGLVATWAYEYELRSDGRPVQPRDGRLISDDVPAHVVTTEASRELVNSVDDELAHDRQLPYDGIAIREGVSEVVQLRHAFTALRMTDYLGAAGLVAGNPSQSTLVSQVNRTTSAVDATEAVVNEIVSSCSFGPLSDLPTTAIQDCRRGMPRFRDYLEAGLTGQLPQQSSGNAHQVAEIILSEYRKIRSRQSSRSPAGDGWDVVGMVLPQAVVVKAMGTRIEWFKYRGARRRPFILLGKLQHYAQEARL
jgi:hypothetical protein